MSKAKYKIVYNSMSEAPTKNVSIEPIGKFWKLCITRNDTDGKEQSIPGALSEDFCNERVVVQTEMA
jgi:hypothetical protein